MAVKLRLRRIGKKKVPIYQIVAADSRVARNGKFIEILGRYEPVLQPAVIQTKDERIFRWLKNGAQPTDTVRSLFRRQGLWLRWTLMRQGKDEATVTRVMERWQMGQAEKAKREEERKVRRAAARKQKSAPGATETAPAEAPAA